jgi:threonylcarbamoyladenosine tRNA methylthiotransferase MtaB
MRYSVITFGCRVNQADSLGFEKDLLAAGAESADPETADLVIVNTCSVTATADQGARQTIRRVARNNPHARIVVTGCYATRRPDDIRALPNVSTVVSNNDKPSLIPLIRRAAGRANEYEQVTTAERFGSGDGSCGAKIAPGLAGRTAFTLRVQTGCAEPCAYCIIPSTRGRPRSLPTDEILEEVDQIVAAGFKEIILTGVHLGSYGRDLTPPSSLVELLRALAASNSRVLFRISSLEPMDCTRDVIDIVATSGVFAPHFHLPLQHASGAVLTQMRRPYTLEFYSSLVDDIRRRMPAASIGSDVIVGFPGETDDDFDSLTSYLERSPLTHIHVFPYSDRPGTAASAMVPKVDGATIRQRARRVRDIGHGLASAFRDSQIGTVHDALTLEDGSLVVTGNYLKVRISPGRARNEWVRVRILSHERGELLAG